MITEQNQGPKPKVVTTTPSTPNFAEDLTRLTADFGGNEGAARVMMANPGAMAWFVEGGKKIERDRLRALVIAEKKALDAVKKVQELMHYVPAHTERNKRTSIFDTLTAELGTVTAADVAALANYDDQPAQGGSATC